MLVRPRAAARMNGALAISLLLLGTTPWIARGSRPEAEPVEVSLPHLDPMLRRIAVDAISARQTTGAPREPAFPPTLPVSYDDLGTLRIACWVHLDPGADAGPETGSTPDPAGTSPSPALRAALAARLDSPGGARLRFLGPSLATGRFSIGEIERLHACPGVTRIEAARRARPLLDESRTECGARAVQQPVGSPPVYHGFSGREVVIGVIDSGADVTHEDFVDSEGDTRIVLAWDQTEATENPPAGFDYGREWTAAEIDQGLCAMTDPAGHGSHVLGAAAGGGAATGAGQPPYRYVGMAPEAIIIVVKTTFFTTDVLDAIDYVFAQAGAWGRRAVVNLSLGHQWGPHDGTEALENAVRTRCGPGRIVVAAAGNQQDDGIHAEVTLPAGAGGSVTVSVPVYAPQGGAQNDVLYIDGYEPDGASSAISITTPHGHNVGPVGPGQSITVATLDGTVTLDRGLHPGPSDHLYIEVVDMDASHPPAAGTWTLHVEHMAKDGADTPITFDFWLPDHTLGNDPAFVEGRTDGKLVASPAGADSVIAVGAYLTKRCWSSADGGTYCYAGNPALGSLAPFSSHGPRRDGVLKPDLCAPGMGIGAALSADSSPGIAWTLADTRHVIRQGTSMAAPHVTGIVALMLEARGALSVGQTLERLRSSARDDEHATGLPNAAWGSGKVDAVGALAGPSAILAIAPRVTRESEGIALAWEVPDEFGRLRFAVSRGFALDGAHRCGETTTGPRYHFVDLDPDAAGEPVYWLQPVPAIGFPLPFGPFTLEDLKGGTNGDDSAFALGSPHPNPAQHAVVWELALPRAGRVALRIVDLQGRIVDQFETDPLPAGRHPMVWDLRNAQGRVPPAGVYWIQARWNRLERARRLLILPSSAQ